MIEAQPTVSLFFKVFLELDLKCFISYLSFDSRSMETLLDPNCCENHIHGSEYPVFFKDRNGSTAIDEALEEQQVKSVEHMIEYICRNQRLPVFAHLFESTFVRLLQVPV